jgi:hypothetical protein
LFKVCGNGCRLHERGGDRSTNCSELCAESCDLLTDRLDLTANLLQAFLQLRHVNTNYDKGFACYYTACAHASLLSVPSRAFLNAPNPTPRSLCVLRFCLNGWKCSGLIRFFACKLCINAIKLAV